MPRGPVKTTTPKSASLLYNNFAANGRQVAYVHNHEAIIIPDAAVCQGSSSPAVGVDA